jgi:TolB-like protein/DNA-binding winged helix-turn-helix (wHTH) protein/Tfp pilus assembly protein PilF
MSNQLYEFGPFVVDPDERLLSCDRERLELPPRVFEVLLALLENRGRLTTREELMQRVWPGTAVEENNLSQAIYLIRKALREGETGARWVETVPKSGYRFVGTVQVVTVSPTPHSLSAEERRAAASPVRPWGTALPAAYGWKRGRVAIAATGLLALAVVIMAGYVARRETAVSAIGHSRRVMLAVLPFANLSGNDSEQYLADGMTEETITDLGRADPPRLGVIARTSVMRFKAGGQNIAEIARELGVDYVLEGSVRRQGNKLRVTAQLIRAADQTHIWAESYARSFSDGLAVQQGVAEMVAGRVQANLGLGDETASGSARAARPQAYDDFVQARFYWNRRDLAGLHDAELLYQKAIAEDPAYAPAYAGLANCDLLLSFVHDEGTREAYFTKARTAALKAIELDESSAEAHTAWAGILVFHDHAWGRAQAEFLHALQLNPNYPQAHHWYANLYLDPLGRYDEAIAQMQMARELDPFNPIVNADLGQAYYFARRYPEALAIYKKTVQLDPRFQVVQSYLGECYLAMGMRSEAVHEITALYEFEYAAPQVNPQARSAALLATYEQKGEAAFWQQLQGQMLREPLYQGTSLAALIYLQAGNSAKAIETLERSCREHKPNVIYLRANPLYDGLRAEARFQAMETELGLPGS